MNAQTENKATGEKVDVKAKIKHLLDIVGRIEEIVSALGDDELGAMQDEMSRPTWGAGENREAYSISRFVSAIVWSEIEKRWAKERGRLMESSPFYRFYHKRDHLDDGLPF